MFEVKIALKYKMQESLPSVTVYYAGFVVYLGLLLWFSAKLAENLHIFAIQRNPDIASFASSRIFLGALFFCTVLQLLVVKNMTMFIFAADGHPLMRFSAIVVFVSILPWMLISTLLPQTVKNVGPACSLYCIVFEDIIMGFCLSPTFLFLVNMKIEGAWSVGVLAVFGYMLFKESAETVSKFAKRIEADRIRRRTRRVRF